jgi:hypothetical protein
MKNFLALYIFKKNKTNKHIRRPSAWKLKMTQVVEKVSSNSKCVVLHLVSRLVNSYGGRIMTLCDVLRCCWMMLPAASRII